MLGGGSSNAPNHVNCRDWFLRRHLPQLMCTCILTGRRKSLMHKLHWPGNCSSFFSSQTCFPVSEVPLLLQESESESESGGLCSGGAATGSVALVKCGVFQS
jgi:hypothetical protein